MVADLGNEKSSIEHQEDHSATAKVAVSDQDLNDVMWAPTMPPLCLAAFDDVNHLRGYGLHEQGGFGPLPYLLKMAHPPFPLASVDRIPLDALTDFHRSQYETEGVLVWKEKKLSESQKENYIAQNENAAMRSVLNSANKGSSIDLTKVVGGIAKRLKQSTQPKALAYKQVKQQYSSVENRKQALKAITLREQLVNVEGRDDILDFSMLNESAQCLLDLNPDDYQSFRESNDRLDAIVRGTNIHLPSRWHYLSYGLTAPFFRIGRILAGCARRNEQAIDERKSGHKPLNQKRGFFYKVSRMVDRAPFVLGGWIGLSYLLMSLSSAHSFADRFLTERKKNKQLKTEKHQEKRRGYLRDEAYGDFNGWAKCIDEYKDLPWIYNRFFAFLGRFLTGDDDGVFGKRKQKRNDYFAKLNNMINETNTEEKDWLNKPPPSIPKAWQVFLSSCQYKLSMGRFFLSQASKSSIRYRYQALRDIRRGYVEKKRTLKALDKGLTGVASLRPSWWARSLLLQSVVAVLRCLLMPLGITWLFGFWHKNNPVSEARASYKIWKSNVDSLLLAMNAKSKLNRRGISQFKALAQHANREVLVDTQQNKESLFADNVTDNDAFSVRLISEQNIEDILATLERKYGKQVSKLKPSDERRQAYANIIYGIALKSPGVLLKLKKNPIVNVPDALLERVVTDNTVRGEDRADLIIQFNKALCNDPMQIIHNIAEIFAKPTSENASPLEEQAEAQGNKNKFQKIKKRWFSLNHTREFFHKAAAKLFKKCPQRSASGVLYSHREFLDITNNRAMRSLSNRIELLRAISGRLEALNDHQAKIIINGLSYHASGVRSCLDACTAFIQNKQQIIPESNKLLLLNIGKAINDCNEENYLGIDVTFSYTDPILRGESNIDRNPQCSCAMRLTLNESRYHVIHDQDLQILTGRQDIDNVIQKTIEYNMCPSEVPAVRSLWKELNPSVMKLHLKIQNFLIEKELLNRKDIQFNSDRLLKKMAYQILNHLRIAGPRKSVEEYLRQEVTLGSVSFKLSDLMPGYSSEKSAEKNGNSVKNTLMETFNEARNNCQRTFSLNIKGDNLDENVTIALAELYMPSQEELTHLLTSLLKLTEAQKNCLLQDPKLSKAIQGSGLVLRNMTTQADQKSTGETNLQDIDNLTLFDAYLELISHSAALTQNIDDMRSKEEGVLHGTDSIDKKSGKVFDLLSRNFLRLYTEICSRRLSPISYRFEVLPKLTQTLARLLKHNQISDKQRGILTELQNRINLKDVSPISNRFIEDVASLLSFNLLQKQNKLFPDYKVNKLSEHTEHIVKSVLAENALLKWSNATGHIDTIANAVEVLSRPNFEEEKVSCWITSLEASSLNTSQKTWIWSDSIDPIKNKMKSLAYYENGKANYNQSIKLALLHYNVTVSNESTVFSVLDQLINEYFKHFNASEHQALIKSIQKFYDRSEVEIKYLLKHVCFTNEFTTIVKMAINHLSSEENNKSKYLVLFWSTLADLAEESREELSINHAGKIAFSHDQALALRGISIQKDLNACEKRLSKYIAGLKNINQVTRTFVIPPAATQELEAIVAPIDNVAMSQADALNKLLLLLPHSFQDLYKYLKNKKMEHLVISKLAKDITPKYAFKLSGLGLASPELWNFNQVTFRKRLDENKFTDMPIQDFVSQVFACDDNNAISSINLGNQEITRAESELGGRIGWYEEVTITLANDVNNTRNAKPPWTDNKYIRHIENLLTTHDESFSNLADFRVMSLFNGIHAHLYQLMTNIIKSMTDVSALGENIKNADIKHLFALASKILPAIPEKKRPYFYAQCVQCILALNQRWYDAVGLLPGGLTPIEIAEDAKLLYPLVRSPSAKIEFYNHRIHQLLLQVKSANTSEYAINFDKRVTSRLILPPTEIGYDTHFENMLKVIKSALKAYDNSLNKNFSDFINEKKSLSFMDHHLESIHSLVNNVHNSLTTDPSILNQAVAYGLDLAQIIRFLGIRSTDKTLVEAMADLKKLQNQAVGVLTDENTINFPQLLSLTVMNRKMQLDSLKTIVADNVSVTNFNWKNEEKLANVCGFDESKSKFFVKNLITMIDSVLRGEAQSKDSMPATKPIATAIHQYRRFMDTIQSLRVAFAAGVTDLANNIFSTDSQKNLAVTVRKLINSNDVFDQMRLCDLLPGLSDYSLTNDIKLIVTSAENIIKNLTSSKNQEKSFNQSCIKIDLVVTFFAHLGLDDEAKKLIILFFSHLLHNYKHNYYMSIDFINEVKQHPVRACLNNWGADPVITKVIATLKPVSIDWTQHNTFLSTKSHDQNFMAEKSRIHILILVAQVLICSKPSEIVPVPVKNINGTVAHKGSLILQKVMDFVHNCASNEEYGTLLEILKKTVLVQNHSDWCWHYVAGNYFTELDSLMAQPEASAKDLIKDVEPKATIFSALYNVLGVKKQPNVQKLGMKLLQVLMTRMLSPHYPDELLQEKMIECAFKEDATLTSDSFSSIVWDFPAMINAAMDYHNLNEEEMKKFICDETNRLEEVYTLNFGDPESTEENNLVRTKFLNFNKRTSVPEVPKFIIHLIRLITLQSNSGDLFYKAVGSWVPMVYALRLFRFILEAKLVDFVEPSISYKTRIDACQPLVLLGPQFMKDFEGIVNNSRGNNRKKNELLDLKKWTFKNIKEENKDAVAKLVLKNV